MAAINFVRQTLPHWSTPSGVFLASSNSFECSFSLSSYYHTLPAPRSQLSPSALSPKRSPNPPKLISSHSPLQRTPYNPFSSPSSPQSAFGSFAISTSLPDDPNGFPQENSSAASPSASSPSASTSSSSSKAEPPSPQFDDWDNFCAELDIDAIVRQSQQSNEETHKGNLADMREEVRKKEEEENNRRKARERELLNERGRMEILARYLRGAVDSIKRAILYERNTHTMRTSLVSSDLFFYGYPIFTD